MNNELDEALKKWDYYKLAELTMAGGANKDN